MDVIRLHRGVIARFLGGALFQPLLALLVLLLVVRAVGQVAGAVADPSLPLPLRATLLAVVVVGAVVAIGAAGYAEFDDAGVRWRYYLPHALPWRDIEQVALVVRGMSIAGVRHTVEIRARGRRRRFAVTPASGRWPSQRRFVRELAAAASARGIAVEDRWG